MTTVHKPDTLKLRVRNLGLRFSDFFASDILDCVTGRKLGRGLLIGFGGWIRLIGYEGEPLVPKFLMQPRLTYWKQTIGFTAQEVPDFPRLLEAPPAARGEGSVRSRVINVLLAHHGGENFNAVKQLWSRVCAEEDLWVAFGGTMEGFDTLDYPRKVYIDDPRLRVRDQQRDKQGYGGIFNAMAPIIEREQPDFVYLCEYDHIPLVDDLNQRQIAVIREEGADVMGHWLYRVDGTGHYHLLYHEADPEFFPFWRSVSRRNDPSAIFSMFGSGSLWRREAFLAVASQQQMIQCYLEIYLPTLAHHLGFRIREWNEKQHLISNIPIPEVSIENALHHSCWTVHPIKSLPKALP